MDEAEPVLQVPQAVEGLADDPVDRVGPLAPAEDQEREARIAFFPSSGLSARKAARIGFPVTRVRPVGEPPLRCRKGEKDPVGETAEDPVGQTRKGVLLGDRRLHSHEPGGEDRRSRGVTAHADDDGGLKFAEDPEGGEQAAGDLREGARGPDRPPSLDAFHPDASGGGTPVRPESSFPDPVPCR